MKTRDGEEKWKFVQDETTPSLENKQKQINEGEDRMHGRKD